MTRKERADLGDVQKTLFLPLWGRSEESKKQNPLLIDETAIRIINRVDFDFSKITQNIDDLTKIAWVKRSLMCDQVIRNFLSRYPKGTIVNIGCGLDTTYERVDNGKMRWYDLDLPDVIELRSKFVQENDRRQFIRASFLEKNWLQKVEVCGNVLFIAAGVFYFFDEQTVKEFIIRLIDTYPACEILFDVSSPLGVKIANKKVVESSGLDEKSHLVWGLEKTEDVLSWDTRIRVIQTYHYYQTQVRGLRNKLLGLLSDFLGIQYMIHLGTSTANDESKSR
jgi:O-methyltransferase involved in polyketide biosynthesis